MSAQTSRVSFHEETSPIDDRSNSIIKKAAVIGAGSMGSGIAAHLTNAGVAVILLDIARDGEDRSALAKSGVDRQLKAGGFMHPSRAELIVTGNIQDDLSLVSDADWVVEAIVEDIDLKRELYRKIDAVRRPGSIVSSNTSTIPLSHLVDGLSDEFAADFVITHFFNPPRIMPLLELVGGERTQPTTLDKARRIAEDVMGKSVVMCRDTPGFIANRIGNYWMSVASLEAMKLGLTVEEADAVMGKPMGIPRTGIFGLFDYVGIQLVPLVWGSFMRILPQADAHRQHDITKDAFFASMLSRGLTGRFGPGGFYRRKNATGERVDEVLDLTSGEYRARREETPSFPSNLQTFCAQSDKLGTYAYAVLSNLIVYTAAHAPQIAEDVSSIDKAMRLGYNWTYGPFELADRLGIDWLVEKLQQDGASVPPLLLVARELGGFYPQRGLRLLTTGEVVEQEKARNLTVAAFRSKSQPLASNPSASVWDIGDGIACLEIHTKMNACDADVVAMAEALPQIVKDGFSGVVIGSDNARAFSAGANLDTFIEHVSKQDWNALRDFIARGQSAWLALKYAPFPVVAAAGGLALGGGCELMMHADEIVAHSELYCGLPERKVGILPGWGGVTQLYLRNQRKDETTDAAATFAAIVGAGVSGSALLARDAGFLRESDPIIMGRDNLLLAAASRVKHLSLDYAVPPKATLTFGGGDVVGRLMEDIDPKLELTATDQRIAERLAWILSGGGDGQSLSEEQVMGLELEAILDLAIYPETLARLQHMRATNKPLQN